MSRYNANGLTPEEQAAQDRLQWESHARTPAGRLELIRRQLDALTAEVVALEAELHADESVDLGSPLAAGPDESGCDLTALVDDPPAPF
jgi:hypothetical protein